MQQVIAYVDGACSGNPGPGGWGVLLQCNGVDQEIFGYELMTTNNRMELRAAIEAIKALKKPCALHIYTDSKYLEMGITQWIHQWIQKGWVNSKKEHVKNSDLWQELYNAVDKHQIIWQWVKGHSSNIGNIRADKLAVKGKETAIKHC